MIEHANIFYMPNFNIIGGTEQFIYEIAKKYHNIDIAVIYVNGDEKQIERLKKLIPVYKYENQKIKCKKVFFNYATNLEVEADNYYQIIHAMYKTNRIRPIKDERINHYLAVSEIAKKEYEELTGKELEVVRNPLTFTKEDKQKPILLISATRLTPEKGKERMIALTKLLDNAGIKWLWLIFTNDTSVINHPNIAYMKPRLDIRPYLQLATYGVQLSDCEGDCYFTRECEALGIPLLVTPIPSFKEQQLEDGKNCYYIPFDMDIDINKIRNIPKYEGYIREDKWDKILYKKKATYKEDKMKVRALKTYKELNVIDKELKVIPEEGQVFDISKERLDVLLGNNAYKKAFVELVEEAKLPKPKEEKAILPKKKKK